ncbi:MAG: ral stress protein [Sphingomonas bacterium]|jgi:general stress protein 26|nr:pyridoxamine 5'-phosphate oxidase family protein [Sphingomonas bacterium]MDB5688154.1 ral stress protein [Sphingomonas bacterium]
MPSENEIEAKFWKELKASPFMMLGLNGSQEAHGQPMTAQLEGDKGPIWFFATKTNTLVAAMRESHDAIATYTSKGHDLFAAVRGRLSVDTDRANLDRLWNSHVASWYEGGKDDPTLALLRLDTESAQLWLGGSSIGAAVLSLLGRDPKQDYKDNMAEVKL